MKSTRNPFVSSLALSLVVFSSAHAGTIWDGGATGGSADNINNATNWDSNTLPGLTGSAIVTFGSATTGGTGTATINTNVNFLGIILNRDGNFLIEDGGGSLTVGASGIAVSLQNTTGRTHTISESSLILSANQTWSITNNTGLAQLTVSSVISGVSLGITKTGSGTLLLSNANTYSGATTVSGGILSLGASGSIANSSGVVLAGGNFNVSAVTSFALGTTQSLTGSGSVTGDITINGTLAIGSSPGTATFNDDLTLGLGTTTSNFEFTLGSLAAGTFDLAQGGAGTQSVTFDGILNLLFDSGETYINGSTVKIFDFENYFGTFDFVNASGLAGGQNAIFDESTGVVSIVPEPSSALLGGLGLLALLRRRRN